MVSSNANTNFLTLTGCLLMQLSFNPVLIIFTLLTTIHDCLHYFFFSNPVYVGPFSELIPKAVETFSAASHQLPTVGIPEPTPTTVFLFSLRLLIFIVYFGITPF